MQTLLPGCSMEDPFMPTESTALTEQQKYYNEIDARGVVSKYKIESGVPVKVAELGNIKDFFNRALARAAVMTPDQVLELEEGDLTHIELAAIKLAGNAAAGDHRATQELADRIVGKAKQVSESTNLTLTIDDVLNARTFDA